MKKVFGRFHLLGGKEKRLLALISEHCAVVVKAIEHLRPLLESAKSGDLHATQETADKIAEFESLADGLHRDAVVAISQGAFFSGTREDFLELMEQIDEVADAAQNAARIITESPIDRDSFLFLYDEPEATLDNFHELIRTAVRLLQESLTALESDAEVAVSKALLVERAEEEADEIKHRLIRHIFERKANLDVFTLLQLRDFVLKLDEIADAAEDSSDLVISLVAKAEA